MLSYFERIICNSIGEVNELIQDKQPITINNSYNLEFSLVVTTAFFG